MAELPDAHRTALCCVAGGPVAGGPIGCARWLRVLERGFVFRSAGADDPAGEEFVLERLSVKPRGELQPGIDRWAPARPVGSQWLGSVLVALIRAYQLFLSPLLGACCRFEPSCSRYTIACIERGGPLRGMWWGARRLCRCHPFCAGGYDPPPEFSA